MIKFNKIITFLSYFVLFSKLLCPTLSAILNKFLSYFVLIFQTFLSYFSKINYGHPIIVWTAILNTATVHAKKCPCDSYTSFFVYFVWVLWHLLTPDCAIWIFSWSHSLTLIRVTNRPDFPGHVLILGLVWLVLQDFWLCLDFSNDI